MLGHFAIRPPHPTFTTFPLGDSFFFLVGDRSYFVITRMRGFVGKDERTTRPLPVVTTPFSKVPPGFLALSSLSVLLPAHTSSKFVHTYVAPPAILHSFLLTKPQTYNLFPYDAAGVAGREEASSASGTVFSVPDRLRLKLPLADAGAAVVAGASVLGAVVSSAPSPLTTSVSWAAAITGMGPSNRILE